MPVAIVMDFPQGTLDQYDQVIEKMGLSDGSKPDGSHFHWVSQEGDGLRVVDVWEDRETFDRFAEEQIGPYTQEVGLAPPEMTFHEVHNTLPH